MALRFLGTLRTLGSWFRPGLDALTTAGLPWDYRWRLLLFQPINLILNSIACFPYLFSRPFTVEWLPVSPGRTIRVLVFDHPLKKASTKTGKGGKARPLHIDMHAGGFIAGIPEDSSPFCTRLAKETGAIVISTTYRLAPRHQYPAAIDDVDAVVAYLQKHARGRWGADPELMTTSGASAGGNLALALSQQPSCHTPARTAVKGTVVFYAPIDLRLPPQDKPKSERLLESNLKDPLDFLIPLYDSYAAPARSKNMDNPRLSPALAPIETLPENILVVVAGIDIVVREQMVFVEKVQKETSQDPRHQHRRIEAVYIDKAFHGILSVPTAVVGQKMKDQALDPGVKFIKDVQNKHGWTVAT